MGLLGPVLDLKLAQTQGEEKGGMASKRRDRIQSMPLQLDPPTPHFSPTPFHSFTVTAPEPPLPCLIRQSDGIWWQIGSAAACCGYSHKTATDRELRTLLG